MSSGARSVERLNYVPFATMASDNKHKLLYLLAKYAYAFKAGGFTLASGQVSDEYLDCKKALSQPEALPSLGSLVLSEMQPQVVAVGGLTMGSDPITKSSSLMSETSQGHRKIRWFSVRKEPKGHGRK